MAKITIPVVTPSLNELLNMNRHARTRLKKSYMAHIEGAVYDMKMTVNKLKRPKRRRLRIWSFRKRLLDPDNFIGGTKPLTDALKELGLIWDDSTKYISLGAEQFIDGYDPRTEIFIEEIK